MPSVHTEDNSLKVCSKHSFFFFVIRFWFDYRRDTPYLTDATLILCFLYTNFRSVKVENPFKKNKNRQRNFYTS